MYFETESISSLASILWELMPSDITNANSLGIFKEKNKNSGQQILQTCKT